ncbi:AAA family ATPase [Teredinibacter sp. KSP-S5-2]|uniref:AAA family ATPase n=1 Tax=Teredinibacter sp. KSP-S5-2 TaxID=3034506 RepID=UPI0029345BD7|nr:AAA family ATPase [Teredinibacter sp. KSP-S5-2]WNO10401.1 AAA family ATPase [Teredinibacter sp. KSP-S5-2]
MSVAGSMLGACASMSDNAWLNFNSADDISQSQIDSQDAMEIKSRILDRLDSVLDTFFPEGKVRGQQFVIGDLEGNRGKSLVVELGGSKQGLWTDFATGEGGDIVDLWARVHRFDVQSEFTKIIQDMAVWLGETPAFTNKPKIKSPPKDELGHWSHKWDYHDADGKLIACVYRYDTEEGKEFRPWDVLARKGLAPNPRPLYNQVGIAKATDVILVEGEKCCDALIAHDFTATTAMNGANAPIEKTDWSPLEGKRVLIWPDNDEAGKEYAEKAAQAIAEAGARSIEILHIPTDLPTKWDAADAVESGVDLEQFLKNTEKTSVKTRRFDLNDWLASDLFIGTPKQREWLCEGVFPMAQVSLLAAAGGVGKSFLLAQLAREVAAFNGYRPTAPVLFGGALLTKGAAVYITAEDDAIEMHIRLSALGDVPDKLYVVPLPDAGGTRPLFFPDQNKRIPTTTEFWHELTNQLASIPDLRVVIFDPLQPLCALDFNVPENAQYVCTQLSALASKLHASVIVSHHFSKREAVSPEQAREAIRGTGGLVDGVRMAYALWQPPVDTAKEICSSINEIYSRGSVVFGGVVKANGRANMKVTTYVRDEQSGILVDRSYDIAKKKQSNRADLQELVVAISQAALDGKPYTKTGLNGVWERRFELPNQFRELGKHSLFGMVEQLQLEQRLVAALAPGQSTVKWLDEPNGPVARGEAKFKPGHLSKSSTHPNKP